MGKGYAPEELEAYRRYRQGIRLQFSTGIVDELTFGYGKLSDHGYWEFPLPFEMLTPEHKQLVRDLEG